jgi:predicted O-methyltransferase YrrM
MMFSSIRLDEFLARYFNAEKPAYPNDILGSIRKRENWLKSFLPSPIVRRLDAGFARSNTVHPDTGNALYSICYATQANNVFETGTYWGYSTAYLAAALQDRNANGKVYSFDIYEKAGKHIPNSLRDRITLTLGKPSTESMPEILKTVQPDVFFQDSRHDYDGVAEELAVIKSFLKPKSVVLFHDFVEPNVQRAAHDMLPGYDIFVLDLQDPQQMGIAIAA